MRAEDVEAALATARRVLDRATHSWSFDNIETLARAAIALADEVETRRSLMVRGYADATNIAVRHAEQRTAEQIAAYFRKLQTDAEAVGIENYTMRPIGAALHVESGAWRKP